MKHKSVRIWWEFLGDSCFLEHCEVLPAFKGSAVSHGNCGLSELSAVHSQASHSVWDITPFSCTGFESCWTPVQNSSKIKQVYKNSALMGKWACYTQLKLACSISLPDLTQTQIPRKTIKNFKMTTAENKPSAGPVRGDFAYDHYLVN